MKKPLLLLAWVMLCIALPVTKLLAQNTPGEQCFVSPTNPNVVNAKTTWWYNSIDQTITLRTVLAKSFVDNTYGANVIGWPGNNHKFNHLVTSDQLQLALYDKNNAKKLEFKMDYFSEVSGTPSGYGTSGVTKNDGAMLVGSSTNVVNVRTSLSENFNTYGYVLTTSSPATNANFDPNPQYPNWIYEVWYEVTVKASAFGSSGFGYPSITGVHASPSKTGNDSENVVPGDCPCKLSVSAVVKNITCNGLTNGAIDITATGFAGVVTYKWSDGVTTEDRTNLRTGTYTVTVTSNPDCKVTQTYTVTQPTALGLTAVTTNISMVGGSTGVIDITATGGTPPYTYKWNDGPTTEDRTGLKAGTYAVTVTDKNGCKTTNSYALTEPVCNLSINGVKNNITCNGAADGGIDVTVSGAKGTLAYLWNDGTTSEDRTNLAPGTYSVTATDQSNGCMIFSQNFVVSQPAVLAVSGNTVNVTMVGGSTGTIDVTASGGTLPYSYLWSDGVTTEDRSNLKAGSYSVTVTDKNGCKVTSNFTITEPVCNLAINGVKNDITCNGAANGSIDIAVTGANGTLQYLWSDGAVTEDRTNLAPGGYAVTTTDQSTGCTASESFTIAEPVVLSASGNAVDVTTVGGSNGSIDITATGGTPPYTYVWSDGVTTEDRTGLMAGTYTVNITDANGCKATGTYTVSDPVCTLTVTFKVTKPTCYAGSDGTITLTVKGNKGAVSYLWNDGVTTKNRTGLTAGVYTVTTTDAAGCKVVQTIRVNQPAKVKGSFTSTPASGNRICDGTVTMSGSGGTAPYTYLWEDLSPLQYRTGLCKGTYYVCVFDYNGCVDTVKVTVQVASTVTGGTATASASSSVAGKPAVPYNGSSNITFQAALSPNPTMGAVRLTIHAPASGYAVMNVLDMSGKRLSSAKISLLKGVNTHQLDLSNKANGMYTIELIAGDSKKVLKVMVGK